MNKWATVAFCQRHGHPFSDADYDAALGTAFPELYARLHSHHPLPMPFQAWADAITDLYIDRIEEVLDRPGALAMIEHLNGLGSIQGSVSNGGGRVVGANIALISRRLGRFPFQTVVHRGEVARGKPDPEPYLLAARRLGLDPARCAVIEDSPTGALAARNAGMLTIAWPQSGNPGHDFSMADHVVNDLRHLPWSDWIAVKG